MFLWSVILLVIYQSQFYTNISFVFKFNFTEGFMYIFVKNHLFDSFDAQTQIFPRNIGTDRRREISRTGREIFVLSEHTLNSDGG